MMMNEKLFLLQVVDSAFPTGAFSHSFGFETYVAQQKMNKVEDFKKWLTAYLLQQLVYSDGLAMKGLYEESSNLGKYSKLLHVQTLAKESREGNERIGKVFLANVCGLLGDEATELVRYQDLVEEEQLPAHQALVFALLGKHLGLELKDCLEVYYFSTCQMLVQNAVRGIPIGQMAGQKLLLRHQASIEQAAEKVLSLSAADFGRTAPGLEIAQMQHQSLFSRNFSS